MKHIILEYEPRYNKSHKAVVRSQPNWFERIFLSRKTGIHEIIVPGKVAYDRVKVAQLINGILKMKK